MSTAMLEVCFGTVNFGRDDTKAHHQVNLDKVFRFVNPLRRKGVLIILLLQEIMEGDKYDERRMVQDTYTGFDHVAWHTMTPILSANLNVLRTHTERASKRIAGITPDRFIVDAVYEHPESGKTLAAVNLHPPQGAFTDPGQAEEAERLKEYNQNWDLGVKRLNTKVHNGHDTIFGGDLNNPHPKNPHLRSQTLINASLDHLWLVPGLHSGGKVIHPKHHVVNLTIDGHNGQFITGQIAA